MDNKDNIEYITTGLGHDIEVEKDGINPGVRLGLAIVCSSISVITTACNILVLIAIIQRPSLRRVRSNMFIVSLGKKKYT
jgi:hypothetical protein